MAKTEKIPMPGDKDYWQYMKTVGIEALKDKKSGRPLSIESPEKLWEYACEYFQEVDQKPFQRQDFIKSGSTAGKKVNLDNIKPYTWAGLENYLFKKKIIVDLRDYKLNRNNAYAAFSDVLARIGQIMYEQKFMGASVGAFKENIISRELHLNETSEIEFTPNSEIKVTVSRKT